MYILNWAKMEKNENIELKKSFYIHQKCLKGKEKLENRPLLALMVGYFLISQLILMVPRVLFYVILAPDSIFGLKSDLGLVKVGEKQLFWSFSSFLLKKNLEIWRFDQET